MNLIEVYPSESRHNYPGDWGESRVLHWFGNRYKLSAGLEDSVTFYVDTTDGSVIVVTENTQLGYLGIETVWGDKIDDVVFFSNDQYYEVEDVDYERLIEEFV